MKYRRRMCPHCREWFQPERHNAWHQRYCNADCCQAASHRASHWRWMRHNPDAHTGKSNIRRVRDWRAQHPEAAVRRVDRHFHLDLCVSRPPAKPHVWGWITEREVGALREVTVPQPTHFQSVRVLSVHALREIVRLGYRNWYQGWRRNERAPPS